ncbi:MAG: exodeoxyribonuclease VII small subunit [Phycisphaera sp.]|nr:exodeoxyribonuclease VII small subunit [Phycisphaera sp.]
MTGRRKDSKSGSGEDAAAGGQLGQLDPEIARLGYEEAVAQLETLVASMEEGEIGLEQSLASYRRGEQLVRHVKALLDKAEVTVRQLSLSEAEQSAP